MAIARWTLWNQDGARGYAMKADAERVRLRELALGRVFVLSPGPPPKDMPLLRI